MRTFKRNSEITSLYLAIYQHTLWPYLSESDVAELYDPNSDQYKLFFSMCSISKYSEAEIKEWQANVAAYTLLGEPGGSLEHLSAYFRTVASTGKICPKIAALLAEGFDPASNPAIRLACVKQQKRGPPLSAKARARGLGAAHRVAQLEAEGIPKEAAVAEVVSTFGISSTQVYEWVSKRAALKKFDNAPEFINTFREAARVIKDEVLNLDSGQKRPMSKRPPAKSAKKPEPLFVESVEKQPS